MMKNNFDVEKLMDVHGFPLYLYDKNDILNQISQVKTYFSDWNILYSMKANPFVDIVKLMKDNSIWIDAASGGEVQAAKGMNFEASEIYYSAPGKSDTDIEKAMDRCTIIADSINEVFRINEIAQNKSRVIEIGIRLNIANQLISNNAFEVMSGVESKFGVSMENLLSQLTEIQALDSVRIIGIHIYFGSQVLEEKVVANNFALIARAACQVGKYLDLQFVNFGGGFGVPYLQKEKQLNLSKIKTMLDETEELHRLKEKGVLCNLELGRYLVANCGSYITKVMDVKTSGSKKYAIVYGGMNSFFRPVFTREYHHAYKYYNENEMPEDEKDKITLVGSLCTPIDQYYEDVVMEKLQAGDIIIFENAGAYGYSMSMLDFISYQKPTQILIGD